MNINTDSEIDSGTDTARHADADALRTEMVDRIRAAGNVHTTEVEHVIRATPRHAFVPDADLATAYDPHRAVITHRYPDGRSMSCASAPWLVATMLEQLQVHPGDRILEIGAGTGYNASLLAQLTGQAELVTTVDIDPDVAANAAQALAATGYRGVHVIVGDGALGHPDHAPYDRIIATVSPWDIPPAWWRQLAQAGGWSSRCAGAAKPAASRCATSTVA